MGDGSMKSVRLLLPLLPLALSGCAATLSENAVAQLKAECAAKGMQFVQTGNHQTELVVVSQARVEGECVGPGDPRYVKQ